MLIRLVNAIRDSITPFVQIKTFPRSACEFVAWALDNNCQGGEWLINMRRKYIGGSREEGGGGRDGGSSTRHSKIIIIR